MKRFVMVLLAICLSTAMAWASVDISPTGNSGSIRNAQIPVRSSGVPAAVLTHPGARARGKHLPMMKADLGLDSQSVNYREMLGARRAANEDTRACSGTVVYDNTSTTSGSYFAPGNQGFTAIADDITLSVGGCDLVCYEVTVYGASANYDVTAALYTDSSGCLGSLISGTEYSWTSVAAGSLTTLEATLSASVSIPQNVWLVMTFSENDAGWYIAEDAETGSTDDSFALNDGTGWTCGYWFSGSPYAGFGATLYCGTVGPANDACADASPILVLPASISGDCTNANTDTVPACGDNSDGPYNNIWYTLAGTGNTITASLCATSPVWDTKISVFCYNCDYLMCVAGNDDSCGTGGVLSSVSWCSVSGETYYITVGGKTDTDAGAFTLDVTDDGTACSGTPCCEVTCPTGATVESEGCGNDTNGGCNSDPAVYDSISCGETVCGTAWADGGNRDTDWYQFTLTDYSQVTFDVEADFPASTYIFEVLDCATSDYDMYANATGDPCTPFQITADVMYPGTYVFWIGNQEFDGYACGTHNDYVVTMTCTTITEGACCNPADQTCTDSTTQSACSAMYGGTGVWKPGETCGQDTCPPVNDECENAIDITGTYPVSVTGTSYGATEDCHAVLGWDAVWYKFDVPYTSNKVVLDFCPTTTDSSNVGLVLYAEPTNPPAACPDDCSAYIIADNSAFVTCTNGTTNPQVTWLDLAGPATYYLPVYLGEHKDFAFDLDVTQFTPPVNDDCENAIQINGPFPQTVTGTTVDATVDCPGVLDWNAVWYKFDAPYTSNNVSIDYCPTSESMYTVGMLLYPEPTNPPAACPDDCNVYFTADASGWHSCLNATTNAKGFWFNLPGPATYYLPVTAQADAYGTPMAFGFTIDIEDQSACDVECPIGGITESEACGTISNDGCYMGTPAYETISCGDTNCGYLYADSTQTDAYDSDWYYLTLAVPQSITWTVTAELPINAYITNTDCSALFTYASEEGGICEDVVLTANLPAGNFYLYVEPGTEFGAFGDGYPCTPTPFEYKAVLDCTTPCTVTCPTGGLPEGESCGDSDNNGCSLSPPDDTAVTAANCGDTYCGTAYADGGTRDMDWYSVTLTDLSTLTLSVEAEFPVTISIWDADCTNLVMHASASGDACETVNVSKVLGAGDYFLLISPSGFYGYSCADGPWDYTATITCGAVQVPTMAPFGIGFLIVILSGLLGFSAFRKRK